MGMNSEFPHQSSLPAEQKSKIWPQTTKAQAGIGYFLQSQEVDCSSIWQAGATTSWDIAEEAEPIKMEPTDSS